MVRTTDTLHESLEALAAAEPAFAGMSYDTLGLRGAIVAGAAAGTPAGAA